MTLDSSRNCEVERRLQGCASRIIKRPCLSRLSLERAQHSPCACCSSPASLSRHPPRKRRAHSRSCRLASRLETSSSSSTNRASKREARVETVSDVSMELTVDGIRRGFDESSIARIDRRRRDSVRNGLAIGLGSGALLGFLAGRAADSPTCPRSGIECGQGALLGTVGGAVLGAVGGWLIDALTHNREVIYLAPASR